MKAMNDMHAANLTQERRDKANLKNNLMVLQRFNDILEKERNNERTLRLKLEEE